MINSEQMAELAVRLVALEQELHRTGLHATARKANAAVKMIGWEFARKLEQAEKNARLREKVLK